MSRVITERHGRVVKLINNDPAKRNAFGLDFYDAIIPAIEAAGADDGVGAVVICGAEGFFCAGGDVSRLAKAHTFEFPERRQGVDRLHEMMRAIRACPKPVIAAVEGGAAGAGASLAAMCDLIVAERGSYFMLAYVKIGLTPDGGATWTFTKALPRQLAAEMALTGGKMPAERLYEAGMVNRLSDDALGEAMAWAAELAEGATGAMAEIKRMILEAEEAQLETQFETEAVGIATAMKSKDGMEGTSAFVEKRKPDFHS
ncbi:MAG: enoyl-CoA hydratase family protein [Pseudomonadota bacterium]